MKIERFAGNREARQALVLAVAGVTAIMLIMNLILTAVIDVPSHRYLKEKGQLKLVAEVDRWAPRPLPVGGPPNGSQVGR